MRGTWGQIAESQRRLTLLQSTHSAAGGVSTERWLSTGARSAHRRGAANRRGTAGESARWFAPRRHRLSLQLLAGVSSACRAVRRAQWLDRSRGAGAHDVELPEHARRRDGAGEPYTEVDLPNVQRLHDGAAQWTHQWLLPARQVLQCQA